MEESNFSQQANRTYTFEMNQKLLVAKDQVNLLNLCRQYHAQSDNLSNITGDNQLPLNGKPSGFELSQMLIVKKIYHTQLV